MNRFRAAWAGDQERVHELVTAASVDEQDDYGFTVLHKACSGGQHHIAEWLVGLGASVNGQDGMGWTPLHRASISPSPRCVQLLLDAGADASIANDDGHIPLHVSYKCAECAVILIAAYPAGVNAVNVFGSTPLLEAAHLGTSDVVGKLLDAGCTKDAMDNEGCTSLYWALRSKKHDNAEVLMERGAHLELVGLDEKFPVIPDWATLFMARRNACRSSCWAVLELARRRSRVIGGNGRDVLGLLSRIIWGSRRDASWSTNNEAGNNYPL